MKITDNTTELIGNTPLVKLNHLAEGLKAQIVVKLEFFNPGNSVKDHITGSMIEVAEKAGEINKGTVVIEATSGNTGIGLTTVYVTRGYKLAITMPESMSKERKILLRAFGTELILTPATEGTVGVITKAQSLVGEHPGIYFMPRQFDNEANPEVHRKTTTEEVWRDIDGKTDIFVAGVGTGGTITGVGEVLKKHKPKVRTVAVEPEASPVLSDGEKGPHPIQSLGAGFIPGVLNITVCDNIFKVSNEIAFETTCTMAKKEGILVDTSSGAIVRSALQLAKEPEDEGKLIIILLPSYGERYLSTSLFTDLA